MLYDQKKQNLNIKDLLILNPCKIDGLKNIKIKSITCNSFAVLGITSNNIIYLLDVIICIKSR